MIYPAKCHWWIACIVVPTSLVPVGLGTLIAYQPATLAVPVLPALVAATLRLGDGGVLQWMWVGISYEIGETDLVNRLGPFRFRVPLNGIEEVFLTRGFRPVVGLGLAWSLAMVHVKYRKASGRRAWPVSVSPQDKTGFLHELAEAVPGAEDRGKRPRTVTRRGPSAGASTSSFQANPPRDTEIARQAVARKNGENGP
jgi:hypothetical protein